MDEDDKPKRKLAHELGMALDAMSVDELNERIEMLEAEIARLKAAVSARQTSRTAAESLFKM